MRFSGSSAGAPADPYTQGQIAALVSTPAAAPAVLRAGETSASRAFATVAAPPVRARKTSPWAFAAVAATVGLLVAGGLWLSRRANENFTLPAPRERPARSRRLRSRAAPTRLDGILARGAVAESRRPGGRRDGLPRASRGRGAEIRERSSSPSPTFSPGRTIRTGPLRPSRARRAPEPGAEPRPPRQGRPPRLARPRAEAREIWESLAASDGPERWTASSGSRWRRTVRTTPCRALTLYERSSRARRPPRDDGRAARRRALYRDERRYGRAADVQTSSGAPLRQRRGSSARSGLASLEGK